MTINKKTYCLRPKSFFRSDRYILTLLVKELFGLTECESDIEGDLILGDDVCLHYMYNKVPTPIHWHELFYSRVVPKLEERYGGEYVTVSEALKYSKSPIHSAAKLLFGERLDEVLEKGLVSKPEKKKLEVEIL